MDIRPALNASLAENLWLTLCFLLSCYFYGAEQNPLLALPALLGPLVVLTFTRASSIEQLRQAQPGFFFASLASICLIVGHQLFLSRAPGTSFVPGIVLASLPLWALVVGVLKNPRQLWLMISLVVTVFAVVSAVEFIVSRQRAHAPFRDPGNYATLLYLVMLPWLIAVLAKPPVKRTQMLLSGIFVAFLLALLATHLRVTMLLVLGIPVLLLLVRWHYRVEWMGIGFGLGAIGAALGLYLLLDMAAVGSAFAVNDPPSQAPSPRALIWQATWQAIVQEGGLSGVGLYGFAELYPQFRSHLEQTTAGTVAHNDLLQLLLEGGLWLLVPMLLFYVATGVALIRELMVQGAPSWRLGGLFALALAMLHATVNFVFYVLPLTLLVAIITGLVFTQQAQNPAITPQLSSRILRVAAPVLLVLNVGWLLLDVTTIGLTKQYRQAPMASYIRETDARLLSYAEIAQATNPRRGEPTLIEARLLAKRFADDPSAPRAAQANLAYRHVLTAQPWNPGAHLEYADFQHLVLQSGVEISRIPEMTDERDRLYRKARALMPYSAATNAALINWQFANGRNEEALATMEAAHRWCRLLGREPSAGNLLAELADVAGRLEEKTLQSDLRSCAQSVGSMNGTGRRKRPLMQFFEG